MVMLTMFTMLAQYVQHSMLIFANQKETQSRSEADKIDFGIFGKYLVRNQSHKVHPEKYMNECHFNTSKISRHFPNSKNSQTVRDDRRKVRGSAHQLVSILQGPSVLSVLNTIKVLTKITYYQVEWKLLQSYNYFWYPDLKKKKNIAMFFLTAKLTVQWWHFTQLNVYCTYILWVHNKVLNWYQYHFKGTGIGTIIFLNNTKPYDRQAEIAILTKAIHLAWLKMALNGPHKKIYSYIVTYTKGHSLRLNTEVAFWRGMI